MQIMNTLKTFVASLHVKRLWFPPHLFSIDNEKSGLYLIPLVDIRDRDIASGEEAKGGNRRKLIPISSNGEIKLITLH